MEQTVSISEVRTLRPYLKQRAIEKTMETRKGHSIKESVDQIAAIYFVLFSFKNLIATLNSYRSFDVENPY